MGWTRVITGCYIHYTLKEAALSTLGKPFLGSICVLFTFSTRLRLSSLSQHAGSTAWHLPGDRMSKAHSCLPGENG